MASWWNWRNFNHHPKPTPISLDNQTHNLVLPRKNPSGTDLIQNCDLPPPLKLFSGADDPKSLNRVLGSDDDKLFRSPPLDSQLELLRALRLSETRAREAETARAQFTREKDSLCHALAEEAMTAFGYRQLLMLMDFEVARLRSEAGVRRWTGDPEVEEGGVDGAFPWIVAFAVCLAVVGVGVAFSG